MKLRGFFLLINSEFFVFFFKGKKSVKKDAFSIIL